MDFTLTETGLQAIKKFIASDPDGNAKAFRVQVTTGGCNGFSYAFSLDTPQEGDEELNFGAFTVVIDAASKPLLTGSQLDYKDTLDYAGFSVSNPNASSSCGCGTSFNI